MRVLIRPAFLRGLVAALLVTLLVPTVTSAHERRDVGKVQLVVGWMVEPSLLGEPNGISLAIVDRATGQPVEGAEKTLKATIAFGGGQPRELPLRARFGQKGSYTADVIPTRTGSYVFTFVGSVGDQPVDEKFESGPGRFDDVQPLDRIQFPRTVPPVSELQAQLESARASASQAQTMAAAGLALGAIGLLLGALALVRKPRAA